MNLFDPMQALANSCLLVLLVNILLKASPNNYDSIQMPPFPFFLFPHLDQVFAFSSAFYFIPLGVCSTFCKLL